MKYRIELRDRNMNFITVLDNRVQQLKWSYAPTGGCAEIGFKVLSKYCTELDIAPTFNIRLYIRNESTKDYDLIYQGRIETIDHNIGDSEETLDVQGFGYQSALQDIVINQTYSSTEVSQIVKDILDNYVVPNTDITYSASDLENTGFTPTTIRFSYVTALDAIQKLAEITGSREWGVDKNRKLFFKQRSSVTGFRYPLGGKVSNFKVNSSSRELVNRVIVIGADVAGSKFVYTEDYTANQNKFKRRDRVIQNSAVNSNTVANQLADSVQAEGDEIVDRASLTLNDEVILETTTPIGLFEVITREVLWDEKEWDTFLWAGLEPFRIRAINYELDEVSRLSSKIELGANLPDIVENIKQLQYNLNNTVQSGA